MNRKDLAALGEHANRAEALAEFVRFECLGRALALVQESGQRFEAARFAQALRGAASVVAALHPRIVAVAAALPSPDDSDARHQYMVESEHLVDEFYRPEVRQ